MKVLVTGGAGLGSSNLKKRLRRPLVVPPPARPSLRTKENIAFVRLAYRLAFMTLHDQNQALQIAKDSVRSLKGAWQTQHKRISIPGMRHRSLSILTLRQMLQQLVWALCEPFEKEHERRGGVPLEDLMLRCIKCALYLSYGLNSAHVLVLVMRVLRHYPIGQLLDVYAAIAPQRPLEERQVHSIRAFLACAIKARFGDLVRLREGKEELVTMLSTDRRLDALVRGGLAKMLLTDTEHVPPLTDGIPPCLTNHRESWDVEASVLERNRDHLLTCPTCFGSLTDKFCLPSPEEVTSFPQFFIPDHVPTAAHREDAPALTQVQLDEVFGQLEAEERKLATLRPKRIGVRINGVLQSMIDISFQGTLNVKVAPWERFVELVAWTEDGSEVVIARHFLTNTIDEADASVAEVDLHLANGAYIHFRELYTQEDTKLEVTYRDGLSRGERRNMSAASFKLGCFLSANANLVYLCSHRDVKPLKIADISSRNLHGRSGQLAAATSHSNRFACSVATKDHNSENEVTSTLAYSPSALSVVEYAMPLLTDVNWKGIAALDLNGDKKEDLLWLKETTGESAAEFTSSTDVTSRVLLFADPDWKVTSTGDIDGDGKADLLCCGAWAEETAAWLINGMNVTSASSLSLNPKWKVTAIGDFDGDDMEVILWRDSLGDVAMWPMNAYNVTTKNVIANIWPGWVIVGPGDINGDGKSDILWRASAGNMAIWLMDGTNVTGYNSIGNVPTTSTVAGLADFNGDEKSDILWRDAGGNVSVWLKNGFTATDSSIANVWIGWTIVGTGDFNGDGKADLQWRDGAGNLAIWMMNGATVSSWNGIGNVPDRTVL